MTQNKLKQDTISTREPLDGGRKSAGVAELLRKRILSNKLTPGAFMPTVRDLAESLDVAKVTVNRAMKLLEQDGWIIALPRHGYRVRKGVGAPDGGQPIAYLNFSRHVVGEGLDDFHRSLLPAFQQVATKRNWPLLTIMAETLTGKQVAAQTITANARGVITNGIAPEVIQRLDELGIPSVIIDAWNVDLRADFVLQDGPMGGMQAGLWAAERGHRRIGWLGPCANGSPAQVAERLGGAVGGLAMRGQTFAVLQDAPLGLPEQALQQAVKLLRRSDRPTLILALWQELAAALACAARELNLVIGRDFEMVGWSMEEEYERKFLPAFSEGQVPPAVVWSLEQLADAAMARIHQRRAEPKTGHATIRIPTCLKKFEPNGKQR